MSTASRMLFAATMNERRCHNAVVQRQERARRGSCHGAAPGTGDDNPQRSVHRVGRRRGALSVDESRKSVNDIEHEGDEVRSKVVHALAKAWITPLDREDLFRFSRSIDDVLDNTRDFIREIHLWKGYAGEHANVALTHVNVALHDLELAVTAEGADMRRYCLEASKESARVRRAYESGLAAVYTGEMSMDTLKTRDLLRRVDVIGLRLGESSDAILDGLVKRGL